MMGPKVPKGWRTEESRTGTGVGAVKTTTARKVRRVEKEKCIFEGRGDLGEEV